MSASDNNEVHGGVDLGGTKIQTVVLRGDGDVLGEAREQTPTSGGPEAVTEAIASAVREAAKAAGLEAGALAAVGVGSPGDVDGRAGTVAQARNLPDFQIETRLRKSDLPIVTAGHSLDEIMANFERDLIMQTLDHNRYNLTRTADQLKISRHALRYRMQRLNISAGTEDEEPVTPVTAGKEVPSC